MSDALKKCNGCGKIKPLSDFPIDRSRKDGRFHWCLDCNKKKSSERRKKIKQLDIENAKLKTLIREFKEFIEEENPKDYTIMSERMDELLTKIEEALK